MAMQYDFNPVFYEDEWDGPKVFMLAGDLASDRSLSLDKNRIIERIEALGSKVIEQPEWNNDCTHVVCAFKKFECTEKVKS